MNTLSYAPIFFLLISQCNSLQNHLDLTDVQQKALHKFQNAVKDLMYKDFMKSDAYHLRWLTASDFNVDEAVNRFKKSLVWRKEKNVDAILGENYQSIDEEYPVVTEGTDKDGRPLVMVHAGIMDFRRIVLSGKQSTYKRFCIRLTELVEEYMHYLRVITGHQNLTQMTGIIDLSGFNLKTTACLKCLAMLPEVLSNFEPNYPELIYQVFFINTPRIFEVVQPFIRSFISEKTRNRFQFLGYDKPVWKAALLVHIPADQLPTQYGGTNKVIRLDKSSLVNDPVLRNLLEEWATVANTSSTVSRKMAEENKS